MSSKGDGKKIPFKVTLSGKTNQTIKKLHQKAIQQGRGKQFLDSLRIIHDRLRTDPRRFGDPLFRLPALKLLIFHVTVNRVLVHNGVHEEEPLVIVRRVILLD